MLKGSKIPEGRTTCQGCGRVPKTWSTRTACGACYTKARNASLRPIDGVCESCGPTANKRWCLGGTVCGKCYSRDQAKRFRENNSESSSASSRKYRANNAERRLVTTNAWRRNNPGKASAIRKRSDSKRRATTRGQLDHRMSVSVRYALGESKRRRKWCDLVGYSTGDLKRHLESLFTGGMSWDAFLRGEIEIDHKVPVSAFSYESPDDPEFKRCWALSNLQPLWKTDNRRKSSKTVADERESQ